MKPRLQVLAAAPRDQWPGLWVSFERALRAVPVRPRTIEVYAEAGRQFHAFRRQLDLSTDPARITRGDVLDFMNWLRAERGAGDATVRARFSALRRFFKWLETEGEIVQSPLLGMPSPKVPEKDAPMLSVADQKKLLAACVGKTFEDRRDAAVIRLMLDSGMRRGEVARMELKDVDFDALTIALVGKGGRPEHASFGNTTARDIDRYLRVRSSHPHADLPALWLAQRGALSGDGIHHMLNIRAKQAGIEGPIHPHMTRHSWAHAMKATGASDEDTMTLGRWRDPRVMRRYAAAAAVERAQATHRRLSPGDRL